MPGTCKPVVSIVRIRNGNTDSAVEEAIELLGGMRAITQGKERVLLKPNLIFPDPKATTKPGVVRTLARLLEGVQKDVSIGEGSGGASPFNIQGNEVCRTSNPETLNRIQQSVFDQLGYTELARSLRVPLINLHTGEMDEVQVPNAFVFDKLTLHSALTRTDMLCSVPMMKTHILAGVTLGIKNLVGAFPGVVYQAIRGRMHDIASKVESSGTAAAIIDMLRANKVGLVVIDGSTAMEGDGPSDGALVPMETIIAGTDPVATDMVAASVMGFEPEEVPTFTWANKAGLKPERIEDIEVRGAPISSLRRRFVRPALIPWASLAANFATREV